VNDAAVDHAIAVLERHRATGRPLGSPLLGTGVVDELEHALRQRLRVPHVVAVSSGTAAMEAALWALGIGPGDEVIQAAYDWPATAETVRRLGADPVLVDVGISGHIDVDAVAAAIGTRTAAVVATHLDGLPANVPALRSLCDRAGVALVEDAAQALGATVDGRPVGSWGDVAVLSFSPGKPVDAGGGGAVATSRRDLFDGVLVAGQHPARLLREGLVGARCPGSNHRIDAVTALLALDGLSRLDQWLAAQEVAAANLAASVASLSPEGQAPRLGAGVTAAWYRWRLVLPTDPATALALVQRLALGGIEARPPDPSFHLVPDDARWPGAGRVGSCSVLLRQVQPGAPAAQLERAPMAPISAVH